MSEERARGTGTAATTSPSSRQSVGDRGAPVRHAAQSNHGGNHWSGLRLKPNPLWKRLFNSVACNRIQERNFSTENSSVLGSDGRDPRVRTSTRRRWSFSPSRTWCRPRSGLAIEDVPASGPAFADAPGKPSRPRAKESVPADGLPPCPALGEFYLALLRYVG
jgi:hypothetical protein